MPRSSDQRSRLIRRHLQSSLVPLSLLLVLRASVAVSSELPGATEINGQQLLALRRSRIDSLRVYAFRGGAPRPIPYQVDERDPRDRWTVERGGRRLKQDETPGVLDENDVVVFMNRDLGPRGNASKLPTDAEGWVEVRVGSEAAPLGFAYVGRFRNPPAPSDVDYVRYDARADRVYARKYDVTFGGPLPTRLTFGDHTDNFLRGMRARGEARFFGGVFKLKRSEKDILTEIEGAVDGPIRVVRPARYWILLPLGFRANARVNLLFYRDYVVGHSTATIKIPPRLVPADGELTAYFELADAAGSRVFLGKDTVGEPLDGRMTPAEKRLGGHEARWAGLILPEHKTFLIVVRPEGALRKLDQRLYFQDRPTGPSFGFELAGVNRLETGKHDLYVNVMLVDSEDPDAIVNAADILSTPPEVHAVPVAKSAP